MRFVAIGCLCVGVLAAVGCADGRGIPTSPSATASVSGSAATVQATTGTASHTVLRLTKTCDAIDHCTVITSSSGPFPVGSDVNYFGPLLEARTTSRIRVTTPGGDTAKGHASSLAAPARWRDFTQTSKCHQTQTSRCSPGKVATTSNPERNTADSATHRLRQRRAAGLRVFGGLEDAFDAVRLSPVSRIAGVRCMTGRPSVERPAVGRLDGRGPTGPSATAAVSGLAANVPGNRCQPSRYSIIRPIKKSAYAARAGPVVLLCEKRLTKFREELSRRPRAVAAGPSTSFASNVSTALLARRTTTGL
jgi:hypothetical protein